MIKVGVKVKMHQIFEDGGVCGQAIGDDFESIANCGCVIRSLIL
jgi:hypothetical protein